MKQLTLGLNLVSPEITYTQLEKARKRKWRKRGKSLLDELETKLAGFGQGESQLEAGTTLLRINSLVIELGSIDPRWLDFSVQVFMVMTNYDPVKKSLQAKKLMRLFQRTKETLYAPNA